MADVSEKDVVQVLQQCGFPKVAFQKEHECVVRVDKDKNVQLMYNEACESLDFFAEVGNIPEYQGDVCCDYLLKANTEWLLMKGSTLAKKAEQETILLEYRLPLFHFSKEIFERMFAQFIDRVNAWKEYLQMFNHGKIPEALADLQAA